MGGSRVAATFKLGAFAITSRTWMKAYYRPGSLLLLRGCGYGWQPIASSVLTSASTAA
jgi:hypothetical protein